MHSSLLCVNYIRYVCYLKGSCLPPNFHLCGVYEKDAFLRKEKESRRNRPKEKR